MCALQAARRPTEIPGAHQRKALRGQATVPRHGGWADTWRRGRNGSGFPLLTWTRGSSNLDGLSLDPLPYRYVARPPGCNEDERGANSRYYPGRAVPLI